LRFLHGADIHLDSPLRGLERYEGAPVDRIRIATREALSNLVNLALAEEVDFVLLAGDIYDGDWKDHGTGLFFAKEMARLNRAKIPVYLIAGNHDARNKMTLSVPLPQNVHVFASQAPETQVLDGLDVAIHGQSFANQAVTENLALAYPDPLHGYCNIGVLHTSLTGRDGHDNYAPCSVSDLQNKGYDYWALGHVHTREIVSTEPPIHFPGNIQGRHIRETGAKGCLLVEGDPEHFTTHFHTLEVLRWEVCRLESPADEIDDPCEHFVEQLPAILAEAPETLFALRVQIGGGLSRHPICADEERLAAALRALATDHGDDCAWVEKVVLIPPAARDTPMVPEGPAAEVLAALEAFAAAPESLPFVAECRDKLLQRLPVDLRDRPEIRIWNEEAGLTRLSREAATLLDARLGLRGDGHAD